MIGAYLFTSLALIHQLGSLLPCPLDAGWQLLWQHELPRQSAKGKPIGGFSGMQLNNNLQQIILLSDSPTSYIVSANWHGSWLDPSWKIGEPELLQAAPDSPLDGEALLRVGSNWWMASEARDPQIQPAELLLLNPLPGPRFAIKQRFSLPHDWQPHADQGLLPNQGPEALLAMPGGAFLLAPERPLRQDPPTQLRLLLAKPSLKPDKTTSVQFTALSATLPYQPPDGAEAHWGLTELLRLNTGESLALWRGYQEPNKWWSQLELFAPIPLRENAQISLKPKAQWDLIKLGLTPDNWEAMGAGPRLADGRPTLLLASDDNFNPFQANRLALLAPMRSTACSKGRP
jgi:hypothetical protein